MRFRIPVLYALLVIIVAIFGLMMFPALHESVEIPLIPLIGLGSWLFGKRTGLILIIPVILYSYFLSNVLHLDHSIYYEAKGGGVLIMAVTAILIGNIRNNYHLLKTANITLDQRVAERNAELSNLTVKLINDVEATRIRHGQMLHDGIGQQLTGIQLYCSSLEEQVVESRNSIASLVYSMRTRAEKAHHVIRKTARLLFPVRMNETGLIPAINELVSCLNELEHLFIDVTVQGDYDHIPDALSLVLYRICHESAMCTATGLKASTIHLTIDSKETGYMVTVRHNGTPWSLLKDNMEKRLILYRLNMLGGLCSVEQSVDDSETIIYRIPVTA